MKKQTIAYHEAGHAVVAHRVGYRVDVVSIVPKGASEGRTKLPNPMRRKDSELDRHRMWVEHAAIIALTTALRPIFCVPACRTGRSFLVIIPRAPSGIR
jgi:Peptidase family M41